jgi:rare lipoprotein A (peptidoglycan hydrolase)
VNFILATTLAAVILLPARQSISPPNPTNLVAAEGVHLCSPKQARRGTISCKASWYYAAGLHCATKAFPPGARLEVTERHNGSVVIVTVNDILPDKYVKENGVLIDLTDEAFAKLDGLALGHAEVTVQQIE